jgi:hypothetical protein
VANLCLQVNSLQQQLEGNNLKGIEQQDDLHVSSSSQLQVQYNDLQQQLQESQTKVQNLQLELHDRLQHQQAAEAAALRLSMACASAEQRADTVSMELADGKDPGCLLNVNHSYVSSSSFVSVWFWFWFCFYLVLVSHSILHKLRVQSIHHTSRVVKLL